MAAVYPEFNIENSCECRNNQPHLRIVKKDDEKS
jgi:hypothetical protein